MPLKTTSYKWSWSLLLSAIETLLKHSTPVWMLYRLDLLPVSGHSDVFLMGLVFYIKRLTVPQTAHREAAMAAGSPFRRLIMGMSVFLVLVVAFEVIVLTVHLHSAEELPAALIGAALTVVSLVAIVALAVTERRYNQRTRQILAGDYLVRWQYTQGEWYQFVMQERTRSIRASLIFLPLTLAFVVLIAWLSQVREVPFPGISILFLLLIAGVFVVGLVDALTARRAFARRAHLAGGTYISLLGILRPDGYRPLAGVLYHLVAVDVVPGQPSQLRLRQQLGGVGNLLALIGNIPAQIEARVPVPYGHEAEAAQVAARLLKHDT
jgi:hypothetical protein